MKRILLNLVFMVGLLSYPLVVSAEDCWESYMLVQDAYSKHLISESTQYTDDDPGWNIYVSESGIVCGKNYTKEYIDIAITKTKSGRVEMNEYVDGVLIVQLKRILENGIVVEDVLFSTEDFVRLFTLLGIYDTPTATVLEVTGQVFSLTTVDAQIPAVSGTIPDIGALLTLDNSSIKIQRNDGTIVASKANTVTVLSPAVESNNSIALVRGEVISTVDCANTGDYEVRTIAADIKVSASCSRVAGSTAEFTTTHSQSGSNATVTTSVASGTVEITERNGKSYTLNAGQEKIIPYKVPRANWVLPVDNDILRGGKDNLLVWKEFPGASSYQMEFNLPTPVFSEENSSRPQYQKQIIPLPSGSYAKVDGDLIAFNLLLPKGADGLVIELRIFALDAAGNIIGESVSSDSSSVTVKD
ncbi:MAG: FecR family protein [gamma proteobacterium symbiont of Taylorina sp.]|nr:FecR family protein [gamma proteobacterium symbiont of Taylorina sp.]